MVSTVESNSVAAIYFVSSDAALTHAAEGLLAQQKRIAIEALTEPFEHDMSQHLEVSQWILAR